MFINKQINFKYFAEQFRISISEYNKNWAKTTTNNKKNNESNE